MMNEKYFEPNSPVELNLPGDFKMYLETLKTAAMQEGYVFTDNILEKLETHCVVDIQEVFMRFKKSAGWTKIERELAEKQQEDELLQKTGMMV
jgi:hypothetical protein